MASTERSRLSSAEQVDPGFEVKGKAMVWRGAAGLQARAKGSKGPRLRVCDEKTSLFDLSTASSCATNTARGGVQLT